MNKRIEESLNVQINTELWSVNLYLSLQAYFVQCRLPILASWLEMQAKDGMERAYEIMGYLCRCGGCVAIQPMVGSYMEWGRSLDVLNRLIEHEYYLARQVSALLIFAGQEDGDFHAFITRLYTRRVRMVDFMMELLRILAEEGSRRLPFKESADGRF